MTYHQQTAQPLRREGIKLDAEAVRAELDEAPESHRLTAAEAEMISNLEDHEIHEAIQRVVDDAFWEQYDSARRSAISLLARGIGHG